MSRAAAPMLGGRQIIFHRQLDGGEIGASQCTCGVTGPEECPIDVHRVRARQQQLAEEDGGNTMAAETAIATPAGNGAGAPPIQQPVQFSLKTELITEMIMLSKVRESKSNPRKHWDATAEAELAASVKQHGVLQPITVRPLAWAPGGSSNSDPDKYEIVAGARRFRAAKTAGLAVIPARIVLLTDEQALEVQLIENLQREGIGALDEALGFRALQQQDPKRWTAEAIAASVGKSPRYVYARMKLCDLGRDAKKALADGVISPSHADELVRLQPADQARAFDFLFFEQEYGRKTKRTQPASVRELKKFVAEESFLDLGKAPFDTASAKLLPAAGACTACPKRAGNSPLFAGSEVNPNTCTDSACYSQKVMAHLHVSVEQLAKKGDQAVLISHQYDFVGKKKKKLPGVLYESQYQTDGYTGSTYGKIRKGSCPDTRLGVYIDAEGGEEAGSTAYVCIARRECKAHAYQSSSRSSGRDDAAAGRRKQILQKKFRARLFAAVLAGITKIRREDWDLVAFEFFGKLGHFVEQPMLKALGWPKAYGDYGARGLRGHLEGLKDHDLGKALIAFAIAPDLNFNMYGGGQQPTRMLAVAARHKVNAAAILAEVKAEKKKKKLAAKPAAKEASTPAPKARAKPKAAAKLNAKRHRKQK